MKIRQKIPKLKNMIVNYILNNKKEYIIVSILFIIGLFTGVIIVNNCSKNQLQEIYQYISDTIIKLKNSQNIDKGELIISSIKNNVILALIIWAAGTTVIGIPIVLAVIIYRGFSLGYTISALSITQGKIKSIIFCIATLCPQNLIIIPAILSLGVSSIKLYKSIIKDKRKENIKIEILRHTIFSSLMLGMLVIASFIENTISINTIQKIIKIF